MSKNPIDSLSDIQTPGDFYYDDDVYKPNEQVTSQLFSSAGDVYFFGVIAYQLITNEKYYPELNETTLECYKKLISKRWAHDSMKY